MSLRYLPVLLIMVLASPGAAFDITPQNPGLGDELVITGSASPGDEVRLRSSFEMDLPVENGKFEYVAKDIEVPQKPNRFSVVAKNVDSLSVGVKMGIWVTMPVSVKNGVASVSKSDVPPGRYTLKMFGEAVPGANTVSITVNAETAVQADSTGEYELVLDTSGVTEGEYKIRVDGEEKVIAIGLAPAEPSRSVSRSSGGGGVTTSQKNIKEVCEPENTEPVAIPDPYYKETKRADTENPDDIVRYVSTARNRAIGMDVFKRAAFYEYYLNGCGFNVSFAYSEKFANGSRDHLWLLVTMRKGGVIEVDPSYGEVGGSSLLPLDPEYSRYDLRFMDIYEASDRLGVGRLAWWTDETARGSSQDATCQTCEEALNVSSVPIEKKFFISWFRDILTRVFAKIGLAF
jgi:hypothetical protein